MALTRMLGYVFHKGARSRLGALQISAFNEVRSTKCSGMQTLRDINQ